MRANFFRAAVLAAAALGSLLVATGAQAMGFGVQPVLVISHDGWASLAVTNPSQTKTYIETAIYDWSKAPNGKDQLVEATDAEISPPGIWVPGGAVYTIRVKMPVATGHVDLPFRIIIRNVPSASDLKNGGVLFSIEDVIPAFSIPPDPTKSVLSGTVTQDGQLVLTNRGGEYVRIVKVTQDGRTLASGLVGYTLPNTRSVFQLRTPVQPGTVTLETDQGEKTIELTR